jgi:hypothetical protein
MSCQGFDSYRGGASIGAWVYMCTPNIFGKKLLVYMLIQVSILGASSSWARLCILELKQIKWLSIVAPNWASG